MVHNNLHKQTERLLIWLYCCISVNNKHIVFCTLPYRIMVQHYRCCRHVKAIANVQRRKHQKIGKANFL
jgi:hypothetical protein